jgi:hypothetical protein
VAYFLNALIWAFVMFLVMIFEELILLTFDNNILPELLQFITMCCWPVMLLIFMIVIMFLGRLDRSNKDK